MRRPYYQRAARWIFYQFLNRCGFPLREANTGALLARVLPLPWRGQIRLFGLPDYLPIRLEPGPGPHHPLQSIVLRGSLLSLPDDPPLLPRSPSPNVPRVMVALLAHHPADLCESFIQSWTALQLPPEDLLLVHGGERKDFDEVSHPWKVFVEDLRLRVRSPRQENQSLAEVFEAIAQHLTGFTHVLFAEYDLVPVGPVDQLCARGVSDLARTGASVIFPSLYRVDTTCQEIYLQQVSNPEFSEFWSRKSLRPDASRVFWALLPGSFWEVEALLAAAANPEPFPCYFEIFVPTLLHHLGFRIQKWPECPMRIQGGGNLHSMLKELSAKGCLAVHPVKLSKRKQGAN